jgi:hypothetical protein
MLIEDKDDNTLSNYDERDILSNFSSEIALDTINQQIEKIKEKDDVKNSSDLFDIFIQKYNFLKTKYSDKDELLSQLEDIMNETSLDILKQIQELYHFNISFSESLSFDDKIHYIHMIYNFFINYIENGIESLLFNYFIKNIKEFPDKEVNKKDQSWLNLKSIIQPECLNQIYYFMENIESMQEYKFLAEDVIELMVEDDPMVEYNYWITSIFIDNLFVDINYEKDFTKKIVELAFQSNKIFKVQNRLIKKYKDDI